jgi:hypothetical protein
MRLLFATLLLLDDTSFFLLFARLLFLDPAFLVEMPPAPGQTNV